MKDVEISKEKVKFFSCYGCRNQARSNSCLVWLVFSKFRILQTIVGSFLQNGISVLVSKFRCWSRKRSLNFLYSSNNRSITGALFIFADIKYLSLSSFSLFVSVVNFANSRRSFAENSPGFLLKMILSDSL